MKYYVSTTIFVSYLNMQDFFLEVRFFLSTFNYYIDKSVDDEFTKNYFCGDLAGFLGFYIKYKKNFFAFE